MKKDIVAIIGAGKGGTAILDALLKMQNVEIKYVSDINAKASGIVLAKKNGINCTSKIEKICTDTSLDLIIEATGKLDFYNKIQNIKLDKISLIGLDTTKIIFHFLDYLQHTNSKLESKVKERTKKIRATNLELISKINEHKLMNIKLQEINNEKTRYLMHATHQLKAPFAAIQSYTDIILDGYTGKIPKKTKDVVYKIKARCEMLGLSIKQMLELANLKSAIKENISFEKNNLIPIAESVKNYLKDLANIKNISIIIEAKKESIFAKCNKNQILILLSVFVENAISYSNKDSKIIIEIEKLKNSKIKLSVKDEGIGIEEKNIKKIFNEYFRTNKASDVYENGSGLGLAIANEIAKLHDTDIKVKSTIGKGSIFSILLSVN